MDEIYEVSSKAALQIIETREPLGLFYHAGHGCFVGIDNSTGDAWTEEFETLEECQNWLLREKECSGKGAEELEQDKD